LAAMPLGEISKFYRSLIMYGTITPYTPAQSLYRAAQFYRLN